MIDPSEVEVAAMKQCLKSFGAAAGTIGFEKPLGSYTEEEALQVIDAIVTSYTEAMLEHHADTSFPPIRGIKDPVADPITTVYDDLEDLPWCAQGEKS